MRYGVGILNFEMTIILLVTTVVLFVALVSPHLLPTVVLPISDAILIVCFVVSSTLFMRFIGVKETKKLERKIVDQHSQMETIINACPFLVFLKTVEGKVILGNDEFTKLFSVSRESLIGMSSYDFILCSGASKREDEIVLKEKRVVTAERYADLANGQTHYFRIVKAPILDDRNNIVSIVVIFRVIDNVKELEDRKNAFIATLTHDLKTPTIAQIKALDLLLAGTLGQVNGEQSEILEQIKLSCNYMYDLIFTILDTYLYDRGYIKLNPERFDMLELVNQTGKAMSNLLKEKGQKLVINSSLQSGFVFADKVQLKRVLINLLGNAVNHGFKDSTITVTLMENGENIVLDVESKSKYITKEQMKDIFEKFKQTQNAKSIKTGTGLGLYLSKQIIDAHKGDVYAKSNEDKICNFGFAIPREYEKRPVSA